MDIPDDYVQIFSLSKFPNESTGGISGQLGIIGEGIYVLKDEMSIDCNDKAGQPFGVQGIPSNSIYFYGRLQLTWTGTNKRRFWHQITGFVNGGSHV